ncbi:MAG: Gfo/Idh/MocA family protein [Halobacteriaceae archaeon]
MTGDGYSVGVVGCGGMGRAHASAYREHDRTEVVAAADVSDETRAAFAEEFGVDRTYGDHAAMLAEADLDVVSVCTWHSTHAEIVVDAAEAGVAGVYCEKPMATSAGETADMLDAADRNGTKLTVGHQRRFDPVHETARDLIARGEIGEPRTVTGRQSGGLLNWGTHVIDMARFLLGDPGYEWVMGQVERRTDRHERALAIEDRCLGHVCFDDGTRLTYESDMPDPEVGDSTIQVSGTEGVLDVHLGSKVTVTNADGTTEHAPEAEAGNRARYLDAFVAWLDGDRDDHRCSGERAGGVMEVMMALYESARTRGVVEAPLETRANPLRVMIEEGDLPVEHPGAYDIRLPYASVRREE